DAIGDARPTGSRSEGPRRREARAWVRSAIGRVPGPGPSSVGPPWSKSSPNRVASTATLRRKRSRAGRKVSQPVGACSQERSGPRGLSSGGQAIGEREAAGRQILVKALGAARGAEAGCLDGAERGGRVADARPVDRDHAGLNPARKAHGPLEVARVEVGGEAL